MKLRVPEVNYAATIAGAASQLRPATPMGRRLAEYLHTPQVFRSRTGQLSRSLPGDAELEKQLRAMGMHISGRP